jgi:hypothetical protein
MSAAFDAILVQLEGVTVLEKPRVSREVLNYVLCVCSNIVVIYTMLVVLLWCRLCLM